MVGYPIEECNVLANISSEWAAGYGPRFGIIHIDFETLDRTVKDSAYHLKVSFEKRREISQ